MIDPNRNALGKRLRTLRNALGLSQRELAMPGVSHAYIYRIEAGHRYPSISVLRQLAARLGVSVHYLETGERDPAEIDRARARLALELAKSWRSAARTLAARVVELEGEEEMDDLWETLVCEIRAVKGAETHGTPSRAT